MKIPHVVLVTTVAGLAVLGCAPRQTAQTEAPPAPEPVREVLTADVQQALTPAQVIADLREGNARFVEGRMMHRDVLAQAEATVSGQYPKAAVLGCVDSRVPPEIIFDQGVGDIFVGRVAGNVEDVNMLGSFEFATKAAGSKAIVVLGHSSCGAIKGAIDDVELGNLTALLQEFEEPIEQAEEAVGGEKSSANTALVDRTIEENVRKTVADILERSPVIAEMAANGEIAVVGAIYDLASGRVTWLDS